MRKIHAETGFGNNCEWKTIFTENSQFRMMERTVYCQHLLHYMCSCFYLRKIPVVERT